MSSTALATKLHWACLAAFLTVVVVFYAFVVSAGHFTSWHTWSADYDSQAEGFRQGHLYTSIAPDPRLLEVPDPLDRVHRRLWNWDYSLYQGHLYIYWGQVPAALLAAVKAAFEINATIGDELLVFLFSVGRAAFGAALLLSLAAKFQPRPPRWAVWLSLFLFVVASPTPFMLARAAIYEAALSGGALFMSAGLCGAFWFLFSESARSRHCWAAATSLALGLAGACRASLLPATALILVLLMLALLQSTWLESGRSSLRPALRLVPAGALPYALLTIGHFVLNQLRFGSWSEYGASYQMGVPFTMGPRFLLPNLWNYAFHPLHFSCEFPFLEVRWNATVLPAWLPYPADYEPWEPLAGLFKVIPFSWLLAAPLLSFAPALRARARELQPNPREARRWRWFRCVLVVATLASSVPVLMLFVSSLRYQAEFTPGLLVLCTLAGWSLLAAPSTRTGRTLAALSYTTLAIASIVLGALFGFSGYHRHFELNNPELWHRLREWLSTCPRA